jgi:nitrogen fixation NifU-like protein
MNRNLADLYQTIMLQHDRAPFHFQKIETAPIIIPAYNPVCGDQFKLFLNIKNDVIQSAHFHGYGCAISKASTSVLVKKMQDLPLAKLEILVATFLQMLQADLFIIENADEEMAAFAAARQFPERLTCATLSWEALSMFLKKE